MLEGAVLENRHQGSEAGDACADDGYVRLEGRPNAEVNTFPFTTLSAISDWRVQMCLQSCDPRRRAIGNTHR